MAKDNFDTDHDFDFKNLDKYEADAKSNKGGDDFDIDDDVSASDSNTFSDNDFDASDFDLDGPPSPSSFDEDGDPDAEFNDFGSNNNPDDDDDFDGKSKSDEKFDDGDNIASAFDDDEDDTPSTEASTQKAAPSNSSASSNTGAASSGIVSKLTSNKIVQAALAAAVVGGVGFMAYTNFMPSQSTGITEPTVTATATTELGDGPKTELPVQQALPAIENSTETPPVAEPDLPVVAPNTEQVASEPTVIPNTAAVPIQPNEITNAHASDPVIDFEPAAPSQPDKSTSPAQLSQPALSAEQMAGFAKKEDLTALTDQISALSDRLADLEDKISKPNADMANGPIVASPDHVEPISAPVTTAAQSSTDEIDPPLKPAVIENVELSGVFGDTAWVKKDGGILEVKQGQEIPGAGVLNSLQNYRGKWIAVTDKGIILSR